MKKITILLLTAGLFITVSCRDFLDEQPISSVPVDQFYATEAEANGAVLGIYQSLLSLYGGTYAQISEVTADMVNASISSLSAGTLELAGNTWTVNSPAVSNFWSDNYEIVNRANAVIGRVPQMAASAISPAASRQFVAEAKFLRALAYFNLVRGFGDVPLKTDESIDLTDQTLLGSRVAAAEVYALIIRDLTEAAADLPVRYTGASIGRVTQNAAKALRAEVHLQRREYAPARTLALEVIQSNVYNLLPDFKNVINQKNTAEHVFSVQYDLTLAPNGNNRGFGPTGTYQFDGMSGFGEYVVTPEYFRTQPRTYRRSYTAVDSLPNRTTGALVALLDRGPAVAKYFDLTMPNSPANVNSRNVGLNVNVLRYATVLLTFAEADFEVNGPTQQTLTHLNQIRRRARTNAAGQQATAALPDLRLSDLTLELILNERRDELAFEGYRRWDLLRRNRYQAALQAVGKQPGAEDVLLPIPQRERDVNRNLTQNPGY